MQDGIVAEVMQQSAASYRRLRTPRATVGIQANTGILFYVTSHLGLKWEPREEPLAGKGSSGRQIQA
jgi:hypothetical protein